MKICQKAGFECNSGSTLGLREGEALLFMVAFLLAVPRSLCFHAAWRRCDILAENVLHKQIKYSYFSMSPYGFCCACYYIRLQDRWWVKGLP
ncbi:hypothetical protein BKA65DRAFT_509408 [Rhexocercosporidium sp. MPI-PUGE-AT-0058]|nr:hypothetical protein BKA65DRAFT_509408 [Rhexocercosporidium sp. MPI-PUGE-AT-0058]